MPAYRKADPRARTARTTTRRHTAKAAMARTSERISAEAVQDNVQSGLNTVAEGARHLTDQVSQSFGLSAEGARQSSRNLVALTQAGAVLARGVQELSREWFGVAREQWQRTMDAFEALARCRSIPDMVAVQGDFVRDTLRQSLDGTRRITETSRRLAHEATQTIVEPAES